MDGKNININDWRQEWENKVPDNSTFIIPGQDVSQASEAQSGAVDETKDVTSFEPYENEENYHFDGEADAEVVDKIRIFHAANGAKALSVFGKVA